MPGIARSRVSASGWSFRQRTSASSPFRATPATSNPRAVRPSVSRRRMNAESSATTTRGGCAGAVAIGVLGGGALDAGEDSVRVQEHDEAVVQLRDALDAVGAGGR